MRTFEEIHRRVGTLESDRSTIDGTRQEISDHVFGESDFLGKRTAGEIRTRRIYDATGLFSWRILSAAVFNFLANPDRDFFDLVTEEPRMMDQSDVRRWVERTQDLLLKLIARPDSGFATAAQEFFASLTGYGMGAIFVEDVPGLPIRFASRPLPEIYVTEDHSGRIDAVWRKFELTHRQAAVRFGEEQVPQLVKKLEAGPDGKTTFWHGVHRADDPLFNKNIGEPWRSVFISLEEKAIVEDRPISRNPFKVARWDRHPGEVYGRGPGWTALPEQRMLNAMSKTVLENAQLKARPPVAVADEDVINPLNLNPEGQNVVRAASFSTDPIRLLQTTGDTGLAVEMMEQQRAKVRGAFMHDLLEILQGPIQTATQVIEMVQKARSLLAPTIARLQVEALEPIINDSFQIALRAQAFDPPPRVLAGSEIKIVYRNPVSRSQQETDSRAIDDFVGFALNVAQIKPEVLDNVDWDSVLLERHKAAGVPQRILLTKRQVEERRQAQAEMAAENRQLEQATEGAAAMGKAAPALRELRESRNAAA